MEMWRKIKKLKQTQTLIQENQESRIQTTHLKAIDSIKLIAQLMIEEQVELSEGCIRIKVLLDHVAPDLHEHPAFSVFLKIYVATEHMPTHETRKKTDQKLIRKLDKERLTLEEKNKEAILNAAKQIITKEFS